MMTVSLKSVDIIYFIIEHNGSMSLGCSKTTKKQPLGCRPENKKVNDSIAILEDTSEALDSNIDGNLDQFKIAFSGYAATIVGIFGIIGNLVSFIIFVQPAMRTSTNYILIGKIFHKQ